MATLCKNCASPIVFDPKTQMVVCHSCGGSWDPQTVDVHEELPELMDSDEDTRNKDDIYKHFMACKVYTCQSCGGEIVIHGSEASTKCIYCGNSSVIFSRISKENAPDLVIPFKLTKEEAVEKINQAFKHHILIPKEIKTIEPSMVRGIYVPFKIVNGRHFEAAVVQSQVGTGEHSHTVHSGRAGIMEIKNLPVDASMILSDESSQQLEPFHLIDVQKFNESYLLGFYSNSADASDETLQQQVLVRGANAFNDQAKRTVKGHEARVVFCDFETFVDRNEISYAMFPVWFATYFYKGQHNTIMVNGQTGKVVCGLPWNEKLLNKLSYAMTAILAVLFGIGFHSLLAMEGRAQNAEEVKDSLALLFFPLLVGVIVWFFGYRKMSKVKKQLALTQASSIYNFAKKRQE